MAAVRYLIVVTGVESAATDALADTLRDAFAVRTAYSGADLAATLDDEVDVALLDPETPGVSGSSLRALRRERDLNCLVGVLTDDPLEDPPADEAPVDDPQVVDEYVRRPAGRRDVDWLDAVESLAARAHYRKRLEEYYELAEQYATVQTRLDERASDVEGGSADDDGERADDDEAGSTDADPDVPAADLAAERDRLADLLEGVRADLAEDAWSFGDASVFEAALGGLDDAQSATEADGDDDATDSPGEDDDG